MFGNVSRISGEKVRKDRKGNFVDGFGNILWEDPENRNNSSSNKIKKQFKTALRDVSKFKSNISTDIQRFRSKAQELENSGGKSGMKYSIEMYLAIPGLRTTQLQAIKEEASIKEKIIKLNQNERKIVLKEEGPDKSTGASKGLGMSTIAHARRIRSGSTSGATVPAPKTRLNKFNRNNRGGSTQVSGFSPKARPSSNPSKEVVEEVQERMKNTNTDKELNIQNSKRAAKMEELEELMLGGFDDNTEEVAKTNDAIEQIPEKDLSHPEQEISIDIDDLGESENGINYSTSAKSLNQKGKKTDRIIKYYKDEENPENDRWWLEYRDTNTGESVEGRKVSLSLIGNSVDRPKIDEVNGKVLSNIGESYELEKVESTEDMPKLYKEEWENHFEDLKEVDSLK